MQPDSINKVAEYLKDYRKEKESQSNNDISTYEKRLVQIDKQIDSAVNRLLDENISEVVKSNINTKIVELENSKNKIKEKSNYLKLSNEQVESEIDKAKIQKVIKSINSSKVEITKLKQLVYTLINEIGVYKDRVEIQFNFGIFLDNNKEECIKTITLKRD